MSFTKLKHSLILIGSLALIEGAAAAAPAFAAAGDSFTVQDIKVQGLNRVTTGAVLLALPVREGDAMTPELTAQAMKRLYATGNFDDVALARDGNTLIVKVKERPTIGKVEFSGNKQVNESSLKDVIEQQGLRSGEALNIQTLNEIKQSLEDFYHSAGMYQAKVNPVLTYLPRNRVDIKLEFVEGIPAEIKQINIVGNRSFDEDVLLAQMQLRDDVPWWNFFANQKYDSQKFGADLEALRSYYLNRGYVRFKIKDSSVEMSPDKKGLYLTVGLDEGAQYTIGKTKITGNTLTYGPALEQLISLEEGDTYSAAQVTQNEQAIKDYFGKFGYAYTRVDTYPTFDEEKKVVNLEFRVEPGSRIYVAQVLISGNNVTDDTVIRREIRQMDGTWLSNEAVETSKRRLNRLGYFEKADIEIKRTGTVPDTVNLETTVKEQPTGSISGGIGYGTNSGVLLQAGISQNNVFGWGSKAAIIAYNNDYRSHMEASYTDPYFTIDQVSLGGRVYYDKFEGDDADVVSYDNRSLGFDISSGYPLSENMSVGYSLGFEQNKIENNGTMFAQALDFWKTYGENSDHPSGTFNNYTFSISWNRNNLDRSVFPTSGSRQNVSVSGTLPGSDLQYYKFTAETAHYLSLDSEHSYVVSFRGRAAYGGGYGKKNGQDQNLPYFENFYLGGSEWLRGFDYNSIGPKAVYCSDSKCSGGYTSDTSLGGNALWAASFELSVPTPFIAEAYKNQVRTSFFVDAGALWDTESKKYTDLYGVPDYSDPGRYRMSAGVAFNWLSPIGPLVFSLAKPIKDYAGDESQTFNFNIGGQF